MKKSTFKDIFFVVLFLGGIAMTSCKDNKETETTTTETTTDTSNTYENSTDPEDGDTIVTATDTVTQTNRDDKNMSAGTQVP